MEGKIKMMNVTGIENVYEVFFKEYPDVLNLKQICKILRVSKKTGMFYFKVTRSNL